jgi:hypothetical protein
VHVLKQQEQQEQPHHQHQHQHQEWETGPCAAFPVDHGADAKPALAVEKSLRRSAHAYCCFSRLLSLVAMAAAFAMAELQLLLLLLLTLIPHFALHSI